MAPERRGSDRDGTVEAFHDAANMNWGHDPVK